MNLIVHKIKNAPVDSNCYIISRRNNCIIVDPGSEDSSALIELLGNLQLIPDYIVLTHEHFDHIWGVNDLRKLFRCNLICSEICYSKVCSEKGNLSFFYNQKGFIIDDDGHLDIMDKILWNGNLLQFIATPGHSTGSICLLIDNNLFCGDTMIFESKTVIKLPTGSGESLKKSFELIYSECPLDTFVNPGHGKSFLLSDYVIRN